MNREIERILREKPEVAGQIIYSLHKFIANDDYLLKVDANERSLTHRIAMYLQEQFENYYVDCEFNRNGYEPKELYIGEVEINAYDANAVTVYPDIIVHQRGSNDENLLVIEFKKSSSRIDRAKDFNKLHAYKNDLDYKYALFIELGTRKIDSAVTSVSWI